MPRVDLGQVVGDSPVINVLENTINAYRLSIISGEDETETPNLRGNVVQKWSVGIPAGSKKIIPFADLSLNPEHEYTFFALPAADYPLFISAIALRAENTVHISLYCNTSPYTQPVLGSPFIQRPLYIGEQGLLAGEFYVGEQTEEEDFPLYLVAVDNGVISS